MKKNKQLKLKADCFILSYKRPQQLPEVIKGVRKQKFINKIYVFHNYPSDVKLKDAINIYSEKNFGCIIRHIIALAAETDYVFFIDDDLKLNADFTTRFNEGIKISPLSVIGLFGRNLNFNVKPEKSYLKSEYIRHYPFFFYSDIIIGRAHLVKKEFLTRSFDFLNRLNLKIFSPDINLADDVILNLSCQMKTKTPGLVIPSSPGEITDLDQKFAVCARKEHLISRGRVIKEYFKIGFKGFLRGEYIKKNNKFETDWLNTALKRKNPVRCLKNYDIKILYNLAFKLRDEGKSKKAAGLYNLVLKADKTEDKKFKALSYYHLGILEKDKQAAKSYFQKCIKLMPEHKAAIKNIKSNKD